MSNLNATFLARLTAAAAALGASGFAAAQTPSEAPAATIPGSCRSIDFNRALLKSPVTVDVLAQIDDAGKAVAVVPLAEVAEPTLLAAVVTSAKSCRYQPALKDGKPQPGSVRFVYTFQPGAPAEVARRPTIPDLKSCAPTADDYPTASRQLNETGTTRVRFTVGPQGQLTAFGVARSSGHLRLDFTALIKLAGCKFEPATAADGTPISASFDVEYVWKLE